MKQRKQWFLITITALLISLGIFAAQRDAATAERDPETTFQAATAAFSEGKYDEAIASYRKLIATHGLSAEILHNLANCYGAVGQRGLAILHYSRAMRLSPGDEDIAGDLAMVRKEAGLFEEKPGFFNGAKDLLTYNQWQFAALLCYVIITASTVCLFFFRKNKLLWTGLFFSITLLILCAAGIWQQRDTWNSGIITRADVKLLISPFKSSKSLGTLAEGSIIYPRSFHDSYVYTIDTRGRKGWIHSRDYNTINTDYTTYARDNAEQ